MKSLKNIQALVESFCVFTGFLFTSENDRRSQEEKEEKEAKEEETRTERSTSSWAVQVFPGRHISRGRAAAVQRTVRKSSGEAQNSMAYHVPFLATLGG